ncbi:MAG: hypothetical protein H6658_18655 [Ardenticatenaceae bacterium]|nr:hypothetical protein [Ardenticatenaceae bacterium]
MIEAYLGRTTTMGD